VTLRIDGEAAEAVLRAAATAGACSDPLWERDFERLSRLCEDGASKTHIAFLATSLLAKAVDPRADLRAIKPRHSLGNPNAYSARSLCHGVVVPLSAELGFSLGVSGREPLNNQPYFRMTKLGDGTPVHPGGRAAFDFMVELVDKAQPLDARSAKRALAAFIAVRRRYQRTYAAASGSASISPSALVHVIAAFVSADSEGGRRAQAVTAGLLDVVFGTGRVQSGRINDPSRHYPGDVAVLESEPSNAGRDVFEKAFEVRDKPTRFSDVAVFGRTCIDRGVQEAAMVLVFDAQEAIDLDDVQRWSDSLGISMTLFSGWRAFIEQCLFWASPPAREAATLAVETIRQRLIDVQASSGAVAKWDILTLGASRTAE
jgi:hypothetical protein